MDQSPKFEMFRTQVTVHVCSVPKYEMSRTLKTISNFPPLATESLSIAWQALATPSIFILYLGDISYNVYKQKLLVYIASFLCLIEVHITLL